MKFTGILMSTPMAAHSRKGNKTNTRREISPHERFVYDEGQKTRTVNGV